MSRLGEQVEERDALDFIDPVEFAQVAGQRGDLTRDVGHRLRPEATELGHEFPAQTRTRRIKEPTLCLAKRLLLGASGPHLDGVLRGGRGDLDVVDTVLLGVFAQVAHRHPVTLGDEDSSVPAAEWQGEQPDAGVQFDDRVTFEFADAELNQVRRKRRMSLEEAAGIDLVLEVADATHDRTMGQPRHHRSHRERAPIASQQIEPFRRRRLCP